LTQAINVTIPALIPNNILISASPASSLVATQSCSLLALQSRNGTTATNVTSNTTVTLSGTNGASFYYDTGCTVEASPLTMIINSGTNSVSGLYIKTANTGNVTISGTSLITVSNLTLNYSAPAPTMLSMSGPILMNAMTSCGNYIVTTQDALGIERNVTSSTTMSVSSSGGAILQFYSDASCSTPLTNDQVILSSGTSSANFYARASTAGSAQIEVTTPGLNSSTYLLDVQ
jgi:hypothetical protein